MVIAFRQLVSISIIYCDCLIYFTSFSERWSGRINGVRLLTDYDGVSRKTIRVGFFSFASMSTKNILSCCFNVGRVLVWFSMYSAVWVLQLYPLVKNQHLFWCALMIGFVTMSLKWLLLLPKDTFEIGFLGCKAGVFHALLGRYINCLHLTEFNWLSKSLNQFNQIKSTNSFVIRHTTF